MEEPKEMVITFVSGNLDKITEAYAILEDSSIKLKFEKIDLPEYQGEVNSICSAKCRAAVAAVKGPVIVEDTSLHFEALNGFPGPYIKWFYEKLGSDGLYRLLKGFEDKSASAVCILGFSEGPGKDVFLCRGETKGRIVEPRGDEGFGWDSCFLPEDMDKTYAELSFEEKNLVSHRRKALNQIKKFFKDKAYCNV